MNTVDFVCAPIEEDCKYSDFNHSENLTIVVDTKCTECNKITKSNQNCIFCDLIALKYQRHGWNQVNWIKFVNMVIHLYTFLLRTIFKKKAMLVEWVVMLKIIFNTLNSIKI